MAAKVTFVNQNEKEQSFKVNLFGPEKNRVKVANVLAVFKSLVAIMGDGSMMEADDDGLSMDTFVAGGTYSLSFVPQEPSFTVETMKELVKDLKDAASFTVESMKELLKDAVKEKERDSAEDALKMAFEKWRAAKLEMWSSHEIMEVSHG